MGKGKKMNIINKKIMASLIALILMSTIAITLIEVPVSNARTPPWTVPTNAYVSCTPSKIGLGQSTTIVVFLDRYSPTSGGAVGQTWDGFKLDITKPDGNKITIGPWTCTSAVASDFKMFKPDALGNLLYCVQLGWRRSSIQ